MLVEVAISVTELARIDANASGIRNLAGLTFARCASPITIGRKKAVVAALLMNELRPPAVAMMISEMRFGWSPVS